MTRDELQSAVNKLAHIKTEVTNYHEFLTGLPSKDTLLATSFTKNYVALAAYVGLPHAWRAKTIRDGLSIPRSLLSLFTVEQQIEYALYFGLARFFNMHRPADVIATQIIIHAAYLGEALPILTKEQTASAKLVKRLLKDYGFKGPTTNDVMEQSPLAKVEWAVLNQHLHLCDSCTLELPTCAALNEHMVYGNGVGNDNIVKCAYFTAK